MSKAVALISGGLDSALAVKLMLNQGIAIQGLFLKSPFGCSTEHASAVAQHLNVPLRVVEKGEAYIDLVRNPRFGYGKNMNPCIDCRMFMFVLAKGVMEESDAQFIVTGEVVGQRPMSQQKSALGLIDHESEMEGLVLRPLSAQLLPPTLPETEGWVDRARLLSISGRSRKEQFQLVEEFGLKGFGAPAGGCLLTDANYSQRLANFFEKTPHPSQTSLTLLRYGRHVELHAENHLIVGRNQEENETLWQIFQSASETEPMTFIRPNFPGPSAILMGHDPPESLRQAIALIAQYAKKLGETPTVEVRYNHTVQVLPLETTQAMGVALPMVVS